MAAFMFSCTSIAFISLSSAKGLESYCSERAREGRVGDEEWGGRGSPRWGAEGKQQMRSAPHKCFAPPRHSQHPAAAAHTTQRNQRGSWLAAHRQGGAAVDAHV